ncbi:MAG TPA: helix-turn-helix domain-containing protein, partial [Candidatus Lokiarchaeia archaeon]|nr:helix-turn-helix domain-containing protein [Candidatus Lokiarchaeia archaeon]
MSEEENKTPQENEGKENESQPLDKILDVIGNSTRRLILKKLARFPQTATDPGGMYPGDLAQHLQISKQGVMKHL